MSYTLTAEAEAKFPTHTSSGTDFKAWAKRFIYRDERGDKTLLHVQVQFAYEAMGRERPKE